VNILFKSLIILISLASISVHAGGRKYNFTKIAPKLVNSKGEKAVLDLKKKKFILVYYSSHWCGTCKAFTPKLVEFYKENSDGLFEVVFMSLDFSEKSQLAYMRNDKMPWLAVKFDYLKPSGLFEYAGYVMPWIAVFKADGTWLPTNDLSLTNHTASQVLANLKKTLLNGSDPKPKEKRSVKTKSPKGDYAAL
jgi:nucleoredoxin